MKVTHMRVLDGASPTRSAPRHGARRWACAVALSVVALWVVPSAFASEQTEPPTPAKKKKDGKQKKAGKDKKDKKGKKSGKGKKKASTGGAATEEVTGDMTGANGESIERGTPKIVVEEANFDFGTIWASTSGENEYIRHTFTIKNEGDAPLKILNIKPACGCTTAGSHPDVLKPGESGKFPFKLKTATLAHAKGGKFAKSINITTNDKNKPTTRLLLNGTAKFQVTAPSMISFGTIKADVRSEKVQTITNNTDTPLKLTMPDTRVTSETPFKYTLTEKEPGKVFELKVTTAPPLKEGRINTNLRIKTNIKEQPELPIRVSLNVPPRIQIRPSMVVYDPRRLTRPVTLTNNGLTDIKVVGASTDDPAIDVTVEETKPGKNFTVKVTFPENYKSPKGDRTLMIETDDPDKPNIKVPIRTTAVAVRKRPAEALAGKPAPSFNLTTVDGKTLNNKALSDLDAVVMTFWAGDCPYCKKALPRLETVRKKYADKKVRFVHVAQTMRKKYSTDDLKKICRDLKLGGELVVDQANKLGPLFKAVSYPTTFVLGKSGKVEMVSIGNKPTLEADFIKKLDQLLGIKKAPATLKGDSGGTRTLLDEKTGSTKTLPGGK